MRIKLIIDIINKNTKSQSHQAIQKQMLSYCMMSIRYTDNCLLIGFYPFSFQCLLTVAIDKPVLIDTFDWLNPSCFAF